MGEKKKMPWQLKVFIWILVILILALITLLIRAYTVQVIKLGPPPTGWEVVENSLSVERIKIQPSETCLIRCNLVTNRANVPKVGYLDVSIGDTNVCVPIVQEYKLASDPVPDVPTNQSMWIVLREHAGNDDETTFSDCVIHIHSDRK